MARCLYAYTKAGNYLAAALVDDPGALIDHTLYWATTVTREEAEYLTAILNAPALNHLVWPFQSVGAFGPRHFDKYVWRSPIPLFDPGNALHLHTAGLARQAAAVAETVELKPGEPFQTSRRRIRAALADAGIGQALDESAGCLLQASR